MAVENRPRVVCLGGSIRSRSAGEQVLRWCGQTLEARGAEVVYLVGEDLDVPHYRPLPAPRGERAGHLVRSLEEADGLVLVSPAYHGTVSGLVKNALDYANDLIARSQPLLDGRPIGCVSVALGDQGAASTLSTLRTITHALRGWPTPLGVTVVPQPGQDDTLIDPHVKERLNVMLLQVLRLAVPNARRRLRVGA